MWSVYVLKSVSDGKYYVGMTMDVENRVKEQKLLEVINSTMDVSHAQLDLGEKKLMIGAALEVANKKVSKTI